MILDAMACGKPVVGTNTGGIPEVVEDGVSGFLVEPRDPQSLAHAITTLLQDEALRTRLGAAGLARVREHFTVDRMVADTLEVYESVLTNAAGSPATVDR